MLVRYEKVDKHAVKAGPQAREIKVDADLHRLADSLVTEGQLQPIGLRAGLSIIWGFRRHAAAMLRDEITHLWAAIFEKEITEGQFLVMRATENFQRLELTNYEKWQTCEELLRLNPTWRNVDLAKHLHFDPGMITRLLSPSKTIPAAQDALKAGAITLEDTFLMARVPEQQQHAILAARLNGASRDQLRGEARKSRNGDKPTVKVSSAKIEMRDAVVVVKQKNLDMSGLIDTLDECLKNARKDAKEFDIKTFQRMMSDRARGGA